MCRDCGINHDRDINAARNIFRFGKEELRRIALAESQCVSESVALPLGQCLHEELAAIFDQTTDMGLILCHHLFSVWDIIRQVWESPSLPRKRQRYAEVGEDVKVGYSACLEARKACVARSLQKRLLAY